MLLGAVVVPVAVVAVDILFDGLAHDLVGVVAQKQADLVMGQVHARSSYL